MRLLPYIILIISFLLKLLYWTLQPPYLSYDEIVTTTISKQPTQQLLHTILAEPHPPGFYFFLKLLPTNDTAAKIAITIISYSITSLTIYYAHKSKLLQKYNLTLGLSLFLSSATFLITSSDIKQDSISIPIFLLTLVFIINSSFFRANMGIVALLMLGYNSYALAISSFILILFFKKKDKKALLYLALQLLLALVFAAKWAIPQLILNRTRFSWALEESSSLYNGLSNHLSGLTSTGITYDIPIILIFILIVILAVNTSNSPKHKKLYLTTLVLTILLVVFNYFSHSFVRTRYSFFTFFLISTLAGWGLSDIKTRSLQYATIIFFFVYGIGGFYLKHIALKLADEQIKVFLQQPPSGTKGVLLESGINFYPLNFKYIKDPSVSVINLENKDIFDSDTIERQHLMLDGSQIKLPKEETLQRLKETNIEIFYYIRIQKNHPFSFFDQDDKIFQSLIRLCRNVQTMPLHKNAEIYRFSECEQRG